MMKKILIILIVLIMIVGGYNLLNKQTYDAVLYYPIKDNRGFGEEFKTIKYSNKEERIKKTLEILMEGPEDKNSFISIGEDKAKLKGFKLKDSDVEVNLYKQFADINNDSQKLRAMYCIVNTLLQYNDIKRVKILIEGEEIKDNQGNIYGYFNYENLKMLDLVDTVITLYFGDSQAMYVVPEKRKIVINKDISKEEYAKIILWELIKGPISNNLYPTIPKEVKVIDVEIDGDLLYVDFSEEMHTKHWRGAAGENMTLLSLANTLTEIEGIERVLPSVEGIALNIEHAIVDQPLVREEDEIFEP